MKFKSYYWAIIAAGVVVIVFVAVLPKLFTSSGNNASPHSQDELANLQVDYTPIISAYQDLITANPSDMVAVNGLGEFYLQIGNYSGAKQQFITALQSNPNDADLHRKLGEAYGQLQMYDLAEREMNSALAINPKDQIALIELGGIKSQTNKPDEARQLWQQGYDLDPTTNAAHMAKEWIAQQDNPDSVSNAPELDPSQIPGS